MIGHPDNMNSISDTKITCIIDKNFLSKYDFEYLVATIGHESFHTGLTIWYRMSGVGQRPVNSAANEAFAFSYGYLIASMRGYDIASKHPIYNSNYTDFGPLNVNDSKLMEARMELTSRGYAISELWPKDMLPSYFLQYVEIIWPE